MFFTRVGLLQERPAFGSFTRLLRTHTSTLTEVPSLSGSMVYGARVCPTYSVLTLTWPGRYQWPPQGRAGASEALEQAPELVSGTGTPPGARSHRAVPAPFLSGLDFPLSGKVQAVALTGLYL